MNMVRIQIDRRTFIFGTLAFTATGALANSHLFITQDVLQWLQHEIADKEALRSPDLTGSLPEVLSGRLADFGMFIARQWDMENWVSDLRDNLISDLMLEKTETAPSYLAEYLDMAGILGDLEGKVGDREKSFEIIAFGELAPNPTATTRAGRFRKYILEEFARYIVSQGGFRKFSPIENYKGYAGGPFTLPEPPYRVLDK
jgi:hypothetical protein